MLYRLKPLQEVQYESSYFNAFRSWTNQHEFNFLAVALIEPLSEQKRSVYLCPNSDAQIGMSALIVPKR